MSIDAIDRLLNSGSGLKGLAGVSDLREVHARAAAGDASAARALSNDCATVMMYIAGCAAACR